MSSDPWPGLTLTHVPIKVAQGERMEIPSNCPTVLRQVMEKCWSHRPEDRPDFHQVLDMLGHDLVIFVLSLIILATHVAAILKRTDCRLSGLVFCVGIFVSSRLQKKLSQS